MRKINILQLVLAVLLFSACSSKFQTQYKVTDKEECKAFFDFLKKEFYRDKKGVLRTTQIFDISPCSKSKNSFDSLIIKSFRTAIWGNNFNCAENLNPEDFYAILGKPDYIGLHPVHKYISCVYFISEYPSITCPNGAIDPSGFYDFKHKMGYQKSPYCHRLEIDFRIKDNSMFKYNFY